MAYLHLGEIIGGGRLGSLSGNRYMAYGHCGQHITRGTPIVSLWQIRTPALVPDIVMQLQTSGQKVWYRQPRHAPVRAEVLTQDKNVACILPWRADLPLLVPLKHLYYSL